MNQLPLNDFMWQLGSKAPPKYCLCCGQPFGEGRERRGPYKGPYMWVCSACWGRPHLFFPDKATAVAGATTDTNEYRDTSLTSSVDSEYSAVRLTAGGRRGLRRRVMVSTAEAKADGQVAYIWQLGRREYRIQRGPKPLSELSFDPRNQRIQYALRAKGLDPLKADRKQIAETLTEYEKPHIDELYWSIYEAGGLLEPLVVRDDGVVIEGNCRLAALLNLCNDYPDQQFCAPVSELLPADFDEEARLLYLGDCHVAGKQKWDTYEIGSHVLQMTQLGKSEEFVARSLRMSKTTVNRYVVAFQTHNEFLRDNPEPGNVRKWSYFFEFEKKKPLRDFAKENPTFKQRFFRWVREGRITAMQVREIPELLPDAEALKALDQKGMAEAKAVHAKTVEAGEGLPTESFTALDRAIQELESLPMKELEHLAKPDSQGAIKVRELYKRLNAVAKMAGLSLS